MADQKELFENNVKLAYYVANKFTDGLENHMDREDLKQIALMQLHVASTKFDEGRGFKFSTYSYTCMRRACESYMKKSSGWGQVSLTDQDYQFAASESRSEGLYLIVEEYLEGIEDQNERNICESIWIRGWTHREAEVRFKIKKKQLIDILDRHAKGVDQVLRQEQE